MLNYLNIAVKKKATAHFTDAICFIFYLWHHLCFCLTLSTDCLTWHQLDWLQRTYTRVGLIWSKLYTSGWVVVLWPCLCWMSAPCLSWEQPTGIPQIWHAAPHTHRDTGRKGKKEKKYIQFPKNLGWIYYRDIKTNFMIFFSHSFFFVFFCRAAVKISKDYTRNVLESMPKRVQGFWDLKFTPRAFQILFTTCQVQNLTEKR